MLNIVSTLPKVISSLDNQQSIAPMFTKDLIDNMGRTGMAYKQGGKHEARERAIEETVTSALWLGGIPASRILFDWAVFKPLKIDPKLDLRLLPKFQKWTGLKTKQVLDISEKLQSKILTANVAKVLVSTAIPLYLLVSVLPKFNQGLTAKKVKKEDISTKGMILKKSQEQVFGGFTKNSNQISFKGLGGELRRWFDPLTAAQSAQINPVDNMLFLDMGISGGRIINARNKHERAEIVLREAGIIFFFFFASGVIKDALAKLSAKVFKTPIELDAKTIVDKELISGLQNVKTGSVQRYKFLDFAKFTKTNKEEKIIEFVKSELLNNSKMLDGKLKFNNITLETANKLGILNIVKNEQGQFTLDTHKFVEVNKLVQLNNDIKVMLVKALKHKAGVDKFMKKAFGIKTVMVMGNMALCSLSLAYFLPKLQYKLRELLTGKKDFTGLEGLKDA